MKLLHSLLYVWLLSSSSCGVNGGLFNMNKRDADSQQQQRRRRLSQENANMVDADAATGTVKPVLTEAEKAAQEAANTCDSQMAQSLVKANESMLQAKAERDSAVSAKNDAVSKNAGCEKTVEKLSNDIVDLKAKVKAGRDPVEKEYNAIIDELKQSHAGEVSRLQAEKEQLIQSHNEYVAQVQADAEERVAAKERQRQDEARNAEDALAQTKEEAKKFLITQVDEVKNEMSKLQSNHEERERLSQSKIRELDDSHKRQEEKTKQFEKLSAEREEEVDQWRQNFAQRRYINFTDMYVDIMDFAETAAEKASETAQTVFEQVMMATEAGWSEFQIWSSDANVKAKKLYNEQYAKTEKFYDEQHAIYWPQIEPHYKQHVEPLVEKKNDLVKQATAFRKKEIDPHIANVQKQLDPHLKTIQKEYNTQFQKVSKMYGKHCKEVVSTAKEMDLPFNTDEAIPYMQQSCSNPETSVKYIQYALIALILFPFRRYIMAPFLWVLGIVWYILLTITPLGFFFSKKKKASASSSLNGHKANGVSKANGVRVKKKNKKMSNAAQ